MFTVTLLNVYHKIEMNKLSYLNTKKAKYYNSDSNYESYPKKIDLKYMLDCNMQHSFQIVLKIKLGEGNNFFIVIQMNNFIEFLVTEN